MRPLKRAILMEKQDLLILNSHHWPRFKEIRLKSLRISSEAFTTLLDDALSWSDEDWQSQVKTLPTLMMVFEGRDFGVVGIGKSGDKSKTAHLISLWVDPELRGQGAMGN